MELKELTPEELKKLELRMKEEAFKRCLEMGDKIEIDLIGAYNHEIQSIIGLDSHQLLAMLYFQGDEFARRQIQKYCYKILKKENLLWERHRGDYHNIQWLENYSHL